MLADVFPVLAALFWAGVIFCLAWFVAQAIEAADSFREASRARPAPDPEERTDVGSLGDRPGV